MKLEAGDAVLNKLAGAAAIRHHDADACKLRFSHRPTHRLILVGYQQNIDVTQGPRLWNATFETNGASGEFGGSHQAVRIVAVAAAHPHV